MIALNRRIFQNVYSRYLTTLIPPAHEKSHQCLGQPRLWSAAMPWALILCTITHVCFSVRLYMFILALWNSWQNSHRFLPESLRPSIKVVKKNQIVLVC